MCGICFTLKQRIHRRPRLAKDGSHDVVPRSLLQQYADFIHPARQQNTQGSTVTDAYWMCPCPCGLGRTTASDVTATTTTTTPTPAGAAATTTTTTTSASSFPSPSAALTNPAAASSLRIIRIFHNRYNRHPLDAATDTCSFGTICANSPAYAATLHNICRRGPDTFGATRRNFPETLLEISSAVAGPAPAEPTTVVTPSPPIAHRGQRPATTTTTTSSNNIPAAVVDSAEREWCSFSTDTQGISAVLGLRGHETVRQPYEIEVETDVEDKSEPNKSYLLWNGEIFNGPMCPPPWGSDTVALASRLSQLERACTPEWRATLSEADRQRALPACQQRFLRKCVRFFESEIQGPYGFLFYASQLQMVVFGRDPLGRHSLLTHLSVYPVLTPLSAQQQQRRDGEAAAATGGASSQATPTTECTQLEVEFLVSSVGSQHMPLARGAPALVNAGVENEEAAVAPGAAAVQAPKAGAETDRAVRPARPAGKRRRDKDEQEGGDNENEADDLGLAKDGPRAAPPCWQELPITGFFGLPLNIPILQMPGTSSTTTTTAAASKPDPTSPDAHLPRNASDFFEALPEMMRGVLLHCPFEGRLHTTHPLLRAAIRAEQQQQQHTDTVPVTTATTVARGDARVPPLGRHTAATTAAAATAAHVSSPTSKGPPMLRTPTMPEPPVSIVPALVSEAVQRAGPRDDSVEEAWVHWSACRYLEALSAAVYRRCNTASAGAEDARGVEKLYRARRRPLCIPFSGGIDCTMLAALAHYAMPIETPIELVSVAFGEHPEQAPDRIAALHAMRELLALPQPAPELFVYAPTGPPEPIGAEREWRLIFVDIPHRTRGATAHIVDLMNPRHTVMDLDIATALWYAARARGRMQRLFASDVRTTRDGEAAGRMSTAGSSNGLDGGKDGGVPSLENFSKHLRIQPAASSTPSSFPAVADQSHQTPATATATATATQLPQPQQQEEQTGMLTKEGGKQNEEAEADGTGEEDPVRAFKPLIDVLVAEGRSSPDGGRAAVLLSTLGKEYSAFLQPVVQQYGYKKLGNYLNDAVKAGVVVFVPDAPSKAVRLKRPEDLRRAVPPPPCPWFMTDVMRAAAASDAGTQEAAEEGASLSCPPVNRSAPLTPPEGTFEEDYCSRARVLLLGMGADETLGGYTRYRRFFQRQGMDGARRELELDFSRLWQRNLGRDDRVTMDSGREPRFPFLDEELLATLEDIVGARRQSLLEADSSEHGRRPASDASAKARADWLLQMSIDPVLSFRLPSGEGDKRILRRAGEIIGLSSVTRLQKRAIQFGTRIAERKIRGSDDL